MQSSGSASLNVPVPIGSCGGLRLGEKVLSHYGITRSLALDEHLSPREVSSGCEELRTDPVAHRGGLGEVRLRLVVAAEDSGEAAEVVADGTFSRSGAEGQSMRPRSEPVEERLGIFRVSAFNAGLGIHGHSACSTRGGAWSPCETWLRTRTMM